MHLPSRQPTLGQSQHPRHAREPFMPNAISDTWQCLLSVPHLGLYLALGWAVYLLGLGGWILLPKRAPVATLSWLVGLAALPSIDRNSVGWGKSVAVR